MGIKSKSQLVRNLLCVLEAAKHGTITAAAEANGMKQSNFSNCIIELEKQINCELFNRIYNGMALTENGREFYKIACDLENVLYKVENFSTAVHKVSGDVRLWISEGLGATYLSSCLPEFLMQYPNVHIEIFCSIDSPKIVQEADMAIVYEKPKQNNAVVISENSLKFGLFASVGYLAKYGNPKSMKDLIENHKICDRDNFVNVWSEWNDVISNAKHIVTTTNSSSMLMRLTKDGIGIGLHPLGIASKEKDLIHLSGVGFELEHPFWIISHAASKDIPKIRALINYIKQAASQL